MALPRVHVRLPRGGSYPTARGFPYDTPRSRGKPPTQIGAFGVPGSGTLGAKAADAAVDTSKVGGRELTIDAIDVGVSPRIIVEAAAYPRWVALRASGAQITIATQANVAVGGGFVLDPGDQEQRFPLPKNARLYGIASSTGATLSRNIQG